MNTIVSTMSTHSLQLGMQDLRLQEAPPEAEASAEVIARRQQSLTWHI